MPSLLTYSYIGIYSFFHAEELKPMHGWANVYERFWTPQLDRVKQRAEIKML